MKIAIVGSRSITVNNLGDYLPENTTEIVSGGAIGVDRSARNYAKTHNIKLKEFLPEYERYGRSAPLKRNLQIIVGQHNFAFCKATARPKIFILHFQFSICKTIFVL